MNRSQPIGTTPGRVTEIQAASTELLPGMVRRRPAQSRRPRRWAWMWNETRERDRAERADNFNEKLG